MLVQNRTDWLYYIQVYIVYNMEISTECCYKVIMGFLWGYNHGEWLLILTYKYRYSCYTPRKQSLGGGILESLCRSVGWLVGWLVGWPVFCPQSVCTNLWSELLPHFLVDWIETWNMYSSWSEDVQDTIFVSACPGIAELSALELWLKRTMAI